LPSMGLSDENVIDGVRLSSRGIRSEVALAWGAVDQKVLRPQAPDSGEIDGGVVLPTRPFVDYADYLAMAFKSNGKDGLRVEECVVENGPRCGKHFGRSRG